MRPRDAKTTNNVCSLRRDNFDAEDFWILIDGHEVTLAEQAHGQKKSQSISIPRKTFNRLIAWYMRDQKRSKR